MASKTDKITIGDLEHMSAILAGVTLVTFGLSRRSLPGVGLAALGCGLVYRGTQGYKRLYELTGLEMKLTGSPLPRSILIEESVTVNKPHAELYRIWSDLTNLPKFMSHIEKVEAKAEGYYHWVAKAPAGLRVTWDAEITREIKDELIGWRSLEGSDVDNAGSVRFVPLADNKTEVRVTMRYNPPGGKLGAAVARAIGEDPAKQIRDDLRRFKQMAESGELAARTLTTSP